MAKKRKKRKTRVKKITIDGITFDSELESRHYTILRDDKDVELLERQKTFMLFERSPYIRLPSMKKGYLRKMIYTPDFIIKIRGLDKPIAVESKGFARKDYNMRKKLFIKLFGDEYYFLESGKDELREQLEEIKKVVNK